MVLGSPYLCTLKMFAMGVVSSQSRLQKKVALSIIEVEYIVETKACKEMLQLKNFLYVLGVVTKHM